MTFLTFSFSNFFLELPRGSVLGAEEESWKLLCPDGLKPLNWSTVRASLPTPCLIAPSHFTDQDTMAHRTHSGDDGSSRVSRMGGRSVFVQSSKPFPLAQLSLSLLEEEKGTEVLRCEANSSRLSQPQPL